MPNRNQNFLGFSHKENNLVALINAEEIAWIEQLSESTVIHLKNKESIEIKEKMSQVVEFLKGVIW